MKEMKWLIIILSFCLFACNVSDDRNQKSQIVETEQKRYYERISDAPIDLYCYVDNLLETQSRIEVCGNLGVYETDNLSADILLSIKDNKVTDVETIFLYFDKAGNPRKDTLSHYQFNAILRDIEIDKVPTLKNFGNGDFAVRMQLERFCIGHVKFFESGMKAQEIIDKANK
jgi:hypothetical protein